MKPRVEILSCVEPVNATGLDVLLLDHVTETVYRGRVQMDREATAAYRGEECRCRCRRCRSVRGEEIE